MLGKGKQDFLRDNDAIAENIQTRLLSFLNDCPFDLQAGIDWFTLLGQKSTQQEIILNCKGTILKSFGVVRVNSIKAMVESARSLRVEYNIDTIYTKQFSRAEEIINA